MVTQNATTYFFEHLSQFPLGDFRLIVSLKDQDFATLWADSNFAAVGVPRKRGDTGDDAVGINSLLGFFHN